MSIRVPDRHSDDPCVNFIPITTIVRAVGRRGVWLEDVANPAGGYTTADYEALSAKFDDPIYATDVEYFGEPTDFDANQRIVIVTTKEVNRFRDVLGFVISTDFLRVTECPSSNEGEVYYGIAPDGAGTVGFAYPLSQALSDAPRLIAHEFTHIIQFGRRLTFPAATAWPSVWEAEGQARLAEEVVGHEFTGRSPAQNYGYGVAFNESQASDVSWYDQHFLALVFYYGARTPTSKVANAPEQCSWLDRPEQGNDGPCLNNEHLPYGVPWSFLRWISDHFGPSYAGGEKGLHCALIDNEYSGFATVADVVGAPIDSLLAQWAAALYVDDRMLGAASRLTMPSWNLFDIFDRSLVPAARLQPRERTFTNFADPVTVRGGSTAYFRVSGAARPATAIAARSATDGELPPFIRLWVVRLR